MNATRKQHGWVERGIPAHPEGYVQPSPFAPSLVQILLNRREQILEHCSGAKIYFRADLHTRRELKAQASAFKFGRLECYQRTVRKLSLARRRLVKIISLRKVAFITRFITGVGAHNPHHSLQHPVLLKRIRSQFYFCILPRNDKAHIEIVHPDLRKQRFVVRDYGCDHRAGRNDGASGMRCEILYHARLRSPQLQQSMPVGLLRNILVKLIVLRLSVYTLVVQLLMIIRRYLRDAFFRLRNSRLEAFNRMRLRLQLLLVLDATAGAIEHH